MKNLPQRKSPRLRGYDYSASGAYFVTLCTRHHCFGNIVDGKMQLSDWEQVAADCWVEIPTHFSTVELDDFVIMPNHVHGIIVITTVGTPYMASTRKISSLGQIIGTYKAAVTRRIQPESKIWQSRYHDHIIRDDQDLQRIREYIHNNPLKWEDDVYHALAPQASLNPKQ